MDKYNILLDYIAYFKNDNNDFYNYNRGKKEKEVVTLGYITYSQKVLNFIKDATDIEFLYNGNYLNWISSDEDKNYNIVKSKIDRANIEKLREILTYYLRGERFCEGLLASSIDEGIILKILYRLKVLSEDKERMNIFVIKQGG